jgi:porin
MKKTTIVILSAVGIICIMLNLAPQVAFGASSNEALEERVERLEKQVGVDEEGAETGENSILNRLTMSGVMAGAYQYQNVSDAPDASNTGRGAFVLEPEIGFAITDRDEIATKFGFAAGNGLNSQSPFIFAPWAADQEDDMKDINGRNRDYLLTAWYKHTFEFSEKHSLGVTGGLIDSTDYLDENAYSNDEFTQFMNEALVNGPNGFLPSYDIGGALEWEYSNFALRGVVMGIGENDDGRAYTFYGTMLGYTLNTALGEGNYRVTFDWTSDAFNNPEGTRKKTRKCVLLSFDQQLGKILGAWIRFGRQDDDAAIVCEKLYSGGIDINGNLWGREQDNIGVGYAYLDGGNLDVKSSNIFEAYGRVGLNEFLAITADFQYMKDKYKEGDNPKGFIYGVRGVVEW